MNRGSSAALRGAWLVVAAGGVAALQVGKLPPALPALQAELGLSLVQSGFLLSMVQLAGLSLAVFMGLLAGSADRRQHFLHTGHRRHDSYGGFISSRCRLGHHRLNLVLGLGGHGSTCRHGLLQGLGKIHLAGGHGGRL